ncbi:MAG: phosphatidylglycerol lysyltransferase domain-containing protein [Odoribacter sp.]
MMDFKPITIKDYKLITSTITPSNAQDCDLSFANLCSWHFMTGSSYTIAGNHLIIRFTASDGTPEYFMPFGKGNVVAVIEELEKKAQAAHEIFCLRGVVPAMKELLEETFPSLFEYSADRDLFDYLYKRKDLVELKGKNYQPKRNHINKFKKEYSYNYQELTPELIPECLLFEAEWCRKHGYVENENIRNERRALTYALHHLKELGLSGAVIYTNGKLAAFTFGAPINHDTFGVHYEKADITIDGAYNIINQEFATHLPEQYIYLNREEDLGIPGLRQAKLSYHPTILLEKYKAVYQPHKRSEIRKREGEKKSCRIYHV